MELCPSGEILEIWSFYGAMVLGKDITSNRSFGWSYFLNSKLHRIVRSFGAGVEDYEG